MFLELIPLIYLIRSTYYGVHYSIFYETRTEANEQIYPTMKRRYTYKNKCQ